MVGLPAFQGVLGEEVQTHRTHHLPRALQTVCNFNILFDNYFLHLCHHPLSKFDTFRWCRQLPKNSETAQKGQKAVICSLNLQLRPLQSDSSCPIFCRKTPAICADIFENSCNLRKYSWKRHKFMQIYSKSHKLCKYIWKHHKIYANIFENVTNYANIFEHVRNLCKYIWKRQTFMNIFENVDPITFKQDHTQSYFQSISRLSKKFAFKTKTFEQRTSLMKASSYSNVGVLLKCDILWKSLRNIAQRAFWLLGKLDSQPLPTNKGHRKNQK